MHVHNTYPHLYGGLWVSCLREFEVCSCMRKIASFICMRCGFWVSQSVESVKHQWANCNCLWWNSWSCNGFHILSDNQSENLCNNLNLISQYSSCSDVTVLLLLFYLVMYELPRLPYKTGLNVTQSHPLCRVHLHVIHEYLGLSLYSFIRLSVVSL